MVELRRWLPMVAFVATVVTAILDTSKVYIFWNENYELSSRQLNRLVCYDWHNFTFLVHDVVYDQVMNAEIECSTKNITTSLEVDSHGQSFTRSLPLRPATQFFQITPLLFEDPIWKNFTEADIFIAVLYQAFLPHEHIDSMMNHVSQSSIFVIAWSQAAFFDLDKSTKAHERHFLIMMSNVIPAHERPKLLELPIPMEELLDDEKNEDGSASLSELTLQLLESSLSKWMKQRDAIATNRDQSLLLSTNHAILQTDTLQGNCTGPRPSVTFPIHTSSPPTPSTPYQLTLLMHINNTPHQLTLSTHPINLPYQLTLLTHANNPPINTSYPINTSIGY